MILPDQREIESGKEFEGKKIITGIWKKKEIEFVAGEIVVKFKPGKERNSTFFKKLFKKDLENARIKRDFDRMGVGLVEFDEKTDVLKVCQELGKNPEIEFVEPNIIDKIAAIIPNDPNYANQWGLSKINAPDAWVYETGKNNVIIAILDSGIPLQGTSPSLSHPDLMDSSRIILGYNYANNNAIPIDDCGHGTHVAGIASAQSNNLIGVAGLSWGTKIYVIKVFDKNGNGSSMKFHDGVIEAVDYALTNNYRLVINYSGGGSQANIKEQAVVYAKDRNCLIVAAAGNDSGAVSYPAAYSTIYDNVIAVSATDSADKFADYSNRGPEINVAAPGSHIYSTMPNYQVTFNNFGYKQDFDYMDGTSMATPFVSALAALMMSCDKTLSPAETRNIIEKTSDDLGDPKWDQYYGYGRIDAYQAVYQVYPHIVFCKYIFESKCMYAREVGFCNYKTEPIFCTSIAEASCTYATEPFCNIKVEPGSWCNYKIELGISCGKAEVIIPGCGRDIYTIPDPRRLGIDPGDIYIRKNVEPKGSEAEIKQFKYFKPLTKRAPLSQKKRYYPEG